MDTGAAAVAVKPSQPVVVALVARPHGLKGGLAIHRFNPDTTSLAAGRLVWLEGQSIVGRWVRVETLKGDRLTLEGISDRAAADALRGAELSVERSSLPETAPDEFYLHDLLGCEVLDSTGRRLGILTGLQGSGSREYFVIKGAGDVWLPADAPIVASVDLKAATIHLNVEVDPEDGPGTDVPTKG